MAADMGHESRRYLEVKCPCCGARLKIDAELGRVIAHEAPPRPAKAPSLDRAGALLHQEAARREAHFRRSADEERIKQTLLDRKFEEALRRTREETETPPLPPSGPGPDGD